MVRQGRVAHDQGGRARLRSAAAAAEPRRREAAPGGNSTSACRPARRAHQPGAAADLPVVVAAGHELVRYELFERARAPTVRSRSASGTPSGNWCPGGNGGRANR
ncbi:hypothetical protein [Actinoallomurus iriomotensis]|uniref:Uncharacterized protein n=1 Tax=Actinoallomurus iriomotensis TaxID=478107 RepID=A0A9W6S4K6_9ACTN|nr:hypothetical protein [Actinoallomurus iriomotensis]GLY87289.1 hypothetical protein Airi02_052180 [Actinoallomurus iriomotensis]